MDRALAVLRARLLPEGRGTWRTMWGDDGGERLAAGLTDLRSPSLFGGPQVLVVRQADTLREEDQGRLLEALPGAGVGGALVLVARAADQRRRLFATCVKAGVAFGFPALTDPRAAAAWVVRLARERGHEIAALAVEDLIERTGTDLGSLAGELDKLAVHVGAGGRIEERHVQALVAAVRGHAVQELTDRLAAHDLAGAARVLRRLLQEGEPPVRVVAFLSANLRRALHVAELLEQGLSPDAAAARLGMPSWLLGRIRGQGRARELARALHVLRRLDMELKSPRDADAALDAALLDIAGPRQ